MSNSNAKVQKNAKMKKDQPSSIGIAFLKLIWHLSFEFPFCHFSIPLPFWHCLKLGTLGLCFVISSS